MAKINWARVFGSGILTGASAFAFGVVLFVGILWAQSLQSAMTVLAGRSFTLPRPGPAFLLLALYMIMGIVTIWLYTTLRPSYGAGPKTAAVAGSVIWLVASLTVTYLTVAGMLSMQTTVLPISILGIGIVGGAELGASFYKE